MPHLLRNLKILEVSSVDRGAGEGVRIVLMKKDVKKDEPITDVLAIEPSPTDIDLTAIDLGKKEEIDAMTLDELKKLIGDQITTTVPDIIAGTLTKIMPDIVTKTVTEAIAKAIPPQFLQNAKDKKKEGEKADDDDETKKALAVAALPASVRKVFDDAEKNAELVTKFVAERELEDFSKRAVGLGLKKEDGVLMQKAYKGDAAAQKAWEERLATVAKVAAGLEKTAIVFSEFGDNRGGREGEVSAYDQMQALAKDLRKKDPNLTEAQAFTKVVTDPANRELAAQERDQRMAKIQGRAA